MIITVEIPDEDMKQKIRDVAKKEWGTNLTEQQVYDTLQVLKDTSPGVNLWADWGRVNIDEIIYIALMDY